MTGGVPRGAPPVGVWCCVVMRVAPRVLWVPRVLSCGPGCLVCPWAAARPRDRHTRASLGVVDLEARPLAVRAASLRLGASFQRPARPRRRLIDFARNSSLPHSNIEFASLELQRFWGVSKNDHDKLRAKCGGGGVVAAHGHRSQAMSPPVGVTGVSRVEFLGCSGACCYKRRQSKAFFVWISDPLLQTSSIRGLFR